MNGELAQLVTLVTFGNLFLSGKEIDLSKNSTFQYVSSLKFARYKSKNDKQGVEIAGSVTDWFAFLKSNHVSRLWNVAFAWDRSDLLEHIAAAFAGSVPRAIQADLPGGYELWYPLWQTGGPEGKPWHVEYRGLMFPNSHVYPAPPMGLVKQQLRQNIAEAEAFARRPQVDTGQWAECFCKSLQFLDSPNPVAPYHPDMLPGTGFDLEARQVMAAAVQAYVFGGMGSWNDMGFAEKDLNKEYQRITKDMYEAVKMSIVMASNSFAI
jgi:hypothetical protein